MKRSSISYTILIITIIIQFPLKGQQTPVGEMYLIDYIYANPAEAGRTSCTIARLADIHQWFGIKDAPNIQVLAAHKSFRKEHSPTFHGLGGILYRDQNGHFYSIGIKAIYAFHVYLNEQRKTYLSFGLACEYAQRSLDETGILNYNSDPALTGNNSAWNPNADFGLILTVNKFYTGFAVLDLLPALNTVSDPVSSELHNRKYSIHTGKLIYVNRNLNIEPSIMFKTNEYFFTQTDLNTKFLFGEKYWLGLSYRHAMDEFPGKSLNGIIYAGIFFKNWTVDYSFTFNIGSFQRYNYGSHGLCVSYKFCANSKSSIPCPAYN